MLSPQCCQQPMNVLQQCEMGVIQCCGGFVNPKTGSGGFILFHFIESVRRVDKTLPLSPNQCHISSIYQSIHPSTWAFHFISFMEVGVGVPQERLWSPTTPNHLPIYLCVWCICCWLTPPKRKKPYNFNRTYPYSTIWMHTMLHDISHIIHIWIGEKSFVGCVI